MTERLIIQRLPHSWRFLSRAELALDLSGADYTAAGRIVVDAAETTPGVERYRLEMQTLTVTPLHEALWPWVGIEAALVAAFAKALGSDLEVIREDKRTATDRAINRPTQDAEPASPRYDPAWTTEQESGKP